MNRPDLDEQGRPEPPATGDEWATLTGFLDFQRDTLRWKTDDLDEEQLGRTLPSHTSPMTLAGLLKHLAFVEQYWFGETIAGEPMREPFASGNWAEHPDWDWVSADEDSAEDLRELWGQSVELSRELCEDLRAERGAAGALDAVFTRPGRDEQVSFRWVLTHMIEEYARHNGHADLLRERVDGMTGE